MSGFSWKSTLDLQQLEEPGDYAGNSLVWLLGDPAASKTGADRARGARWHELFSSGPPITGMMLERPRPETLELLPLLPQLQEIWIRDYSSILDLDAIASTKSLEVLYLGYPRKISDYSALARLEGLRYLSVFTSHDDLDYSSLGGLVHLEHLLVLGSGRRRTRVDDFAWVGGLTKLQALIIPSVRPRDPDVSAIAALPDLNHLSLPHGIEVRRRVEELAPTHPAFAHAARAYELGTEALERARTST